MVRAFLPLVAVLDVYPAVPEVCRDRPEMDDAGLIRIVAVGLGAGGVAGTGGTSGGGGGDPMLSVPMGDERIALFFKEVEQTVRCPD